MLLLIFCLVVVRERKPMHLNNFGGMSLLPKFMAEDHMPRVKDPIDQIRAEGSRQKIEDPIDRIRAEGPRLWVKLRPKTELELKVKL